MIQKQPAGGCDPAVDDMQKVSLNILLSDTFLCKQIEESLLFCNGFDYSIIFDDCQLYQLSIFSEILYKNTKEILKFANSWIV